MLLSFAQFEREVTAERVRDKIAASKAKGFWMGGTVPIGYRTEARSLQPAPEEAALVRGIFARYLALGSVSKLKSELDAPGIRTPERLHRSGSRGGGAAISRGRLYDLLANDPCRFDRLVYFVDNRDQAAAEAVGRIWVSAPARRPRGDRCRRPLPGRAAGRCGSRATGRRRARPAPA